LILVLSLSCVLSSGIRRRNKARGVVDALNRAAEKIGKKVKGFTTSNLFCCIRGFADTGMKDSTNPVAQIGVCALTAFKNYAEYNAGKSDAAVVPDAAGAGATTDAALDAALTKDAAAVEKVAAADTSSSAKLDDGAAAVADDKAVKDAIVDTPTDAEATAATADAPSRLEDDDDDSDEADRKERGLFDWIKKQFAKFKGWLTKNLPGLKKLAGYIAKLFNKATIHAIIDFVKCAKPSVSAVLNTEFGGSKGEKNTVKGITSETMTKLLSKLPSILKAGFSMVKSLISAAKESDRCKKWEKYGNAAGVGFTAIMDALKKKAI